VERHVRTGVTLVVLAGILVAAAYFGWLGLTRGWVGGDDRASAADGPRRSCSTPPPATVRAPRIRVSVYNAGAPEGQATEVMEALAGQGFREGELTDAPDRIDVDGVVLWPGAAGPGEVRLVRRQFDDARVAPRRGPLGPGINVLVGEAFDGLARGAPRSLQVARPPVCTRIS
jgi:LytR cell envelope-related transcriptional attenuator